MLSLVDAGLHTEALNEYWPKMILATAVEMACYVLVEPDYFNLIVLVKTLITFSLWMKDEKQWVSLPLLTLHKYPTG